MKFSSKYVIAIASFLAIAVILGGGFFYFQSQKAKYSQSNSQAQSEVKKLVEEVGKLIDLPTNEEPTVATVTDISKLKDQPFFIKAKNGDKILIYSQARKAILYDPTAKKILDVAPINIGSQSAQVASPSPTPR